MGTCAWTYKDWNGPFYPPHLPDNQHLPFYAKYFNAVEINSTFYHSPGRKNATHWAEAVPDDFVFTCKMPKEITHEHKLRNCEEPLAKFLEDIEPMQSKLGCILIQLSEYFKPSRDELALREFIHRLPQGFRFAVEFRDPAWHVPRIAHLLEQRSVCWAWNDLTTLDHGNEAAFTFLPRTTDFIYVRLMGDLGIKYDGDGNKRFTYKKLLWPRDAALENWATKIRQEADDSVKVFVLVSNHFEGFAPETCVRIGAQLGMSLELPTVKPEAKGKGSDGQLDLGL